MTEVKMCAFCQEKPAVFDQPVSCSVCFLGFIGTLNAVRASRLERESTDERTQDGGD